MLTACFAFASIGIVEAQVSKDESKIVMTQDELESFLKTVADSRRKQNQKKAEKRADQERSDRDFRMMMSQRQGSTDMRQQASFGSNAEIMRELQYISRRLDELTMRSYGYMPSGTNPSGTRDNTTVIMPGGQQGMPYYPGQQTGTQIIPGQSAAPATGTADPELLAMQLRLAQLQQEAAARQGQGAQSESYQREFAELNQQIAALQNQLNNRQTQNKEYDELMSRYGTFKSQIFFANNSVELSDSDIQKIREIIPVLRENRRMNILLKGFASKRGNPVYNNNLSLRRTEAVKSAFISNGLSPDQIITVHHGEDYTTDEANARRVDMTYIINR
ncbi:MAG: OmpA family protein [Weeksellaceae bacterium]|nr:OmpA family protein [Weeksellaceae bacterium]